jgi:hypothetical protein
MLNPRRPMWPVPVRLLDSNESVASPVDEPALHGSLRVALGAGRFED